MKFLTGFLKRRARLLTLLSGSFIVSIWTILRHISNGINFDVVGQIGLAQQWADNMHAGAQLGATNYVLKIPLYMLINTMSFISPMNRLLILALVCNVFTFIALCILLEKIAKLYGANMHTWLYLGLLWLATIAGNVFWADYANSRNLETVGGILFVYLMLKFMRSRWPATALQAILMGSVVFFADSLQLYVCGIGLCLFVTGRFVVRRTRSEAKVAAAVIVSTGLAYLGAKLIRMIIEHVLNVSFLVAPREPVTISVATVAHIVRNLFVSTLDIFGANVFKRPFDLNTGRELLSLILLFGIVLLLIRAYIAQANVRARLGIGVAAAAITANYLVYAASGQASVFNTYRYLIMVPLLLLVLLACLGESFKFKKPTYTGQLQLGVLAILVVSSVMLVGALATNWPTRHSNDAHIYATRSFLRANDITYTLSSREVGITTTYFAQGSSVVLPLLCTPDHRLLPTDLFYDKAAFTNFRRYQKPTAILVPGAGINSGATVCDQAAVEAQFGQPSSETVVPGVGVALRYPPGQLQSKLPDITLR